MTTTKKISELPSAVLPLDGDEVLPVVQDGATRRISVDDIKDGLASLTHNHVLADIADAGSAAGAEVSDFATAAQGAKADSALQDAGAFATAAQGALADTALQPGGLAAVATSGDYDDLVNAPEPGGVNAIINGGCLVSTRDQLSLTTSWQYGPVDLLAVRAQGSVSNGDIRQLLGAYSLTQTGAACWVEKATLNASGKIEFRYRIESRDARAFYNAGAHFSARVYHDTGSTEDYDITVNKPDNEDDFSNVTQIDFGTVQIANDTNADLDYSIADLGDCRNGLEIIVSVDCGAVSQKSFFMAQMQLSKGTTKKPFETRPMAMEREMVKRFLSPVMLVSAVANSGSNMQAVFQHPGMRIAPSYEVTAAIAMTDGYVADKTQSQGSVTTVHENNENHGRVDIAYFSGLTSGRHYIHRGTGGRILASAEL